MNCSELYTNLPRTCFFFFFFSPSETFIPMKACEMESLLASFVKISARSEKVNGSHGNAVIGEKKKKNYLKNFSYIRLITAADKKKKKKKGFR